MNAGDLLDRIRQTVRQGSCRFTLHGLREATADDLAVDAVWDAIISAEAEIIEDYPDNPRGPSCLILSWTPDRRPVHAVVSYPPVVAVITVYVPDPDEWLDYRFRR